MTETDTRPERDAELDDDASVSLNPLLITALVIAVVAALVFLLLWIRATGTDPTEITQYIRAEASVIEDRAADVIDLLLNYDSTNFTEKADELRTLATGSFRDQYETLIEQGLGAALEEETASSSGEIVQGPDISFTSATEATVVARVRQTTKSDQTPGGRSFFYVLQIDFVKSGDDWLADRLDILAEAST